MYFESIILDQIKTTEGNLEIELTDPTCVHQDQFYAVGRVCSDSILEGAKFNEKSCMLEVSKTMGIGLRVLLNLSEVFLEDTDVCLFPGQVIGIKGTSYNDKPLTLLLFLLSFLSLLLL